MSRRNSPLRLTLLAALLCGPAGAPPDRIEVAHYRGEGIFDRYPATVVIAPHESTLRYRRFGGEHALSFSTSRLVDLLRRFSRPGLWLIPRSDGSFSLARFSHPVLVDANGEILWFGLFLVEGETGRNRPKLVHESATEGPFPDITATFTSPTRETVSSTCGDRVAS